VSPHSILPKTALNQTISSLIIDTLTCIHGVKKCNIPNHRKHLHTMPPSFGFTTNANAQSIRQAL
jgi:hypothetical protein